MAKLKKYASPEEAYKYCYLKGLSFPDNWYITNNFSWNEAFKNERKSDGKPILEIFQNVFLTAIQLQSARTKIGKPFNIHCWVRQIPHNIRAGSTAVFSPHINGRAVDFSVTNVKPEQVREQLLKLNLPIRIEAGTPTWVHVDIGNSYTENFKWGLFYP